MEKQTILSINNREKSVCYTFEKKSSYYEFLLSLLKNLGVSQLPDLYDDYGKLPDVTKEVDEYFYWKKGSTEINEVVGANKIFLVIQTKEMDKLREFMEKNTQFKQ